MKFFILAGGYGERARPLSLFLPKPLFPLGGRPIIAKIIDCFAEARITSGFCNCHHLAQELERFLQNYSQIEMIYEPELTGTLVLRQALKLLDDDDLLIVQNGDTYLRPPVQTMVKSLRTDTDGLILVVTAKNSPYQKLKIESGLITGFEERKSSGWTYAGCGLFRVSFLKKLRQKNFFEDIFISNLRIQAVPYNGEWVEFTSPRSYFAQNWEFVKRRDRKVKNIFSGGVEVDRRIVAEQTIFWPQTKLEGRAKVNNSIVIGSCQVEGYYTNKIITPARIYELE